MLGSLVKYLHTGIKVFFMSVKIANLRLLAGKTGWYFFSTGILTGHTPEPVLFKKEPGKKWSDPHGDMGS